MKGLDDKELCNVIRQGLEYIKKSGLKNGTYPLISPDDIEIITGNNVRIRQQRAAEESLSQCLQAFGITLYHLASGRSEHASESYKMDGYATEIQSKYWQIIRLMISGNARSIPQIEGEISWKKDFSTQTLCPLKTKSVKWSKAFIARLSQWVDACSATIVKAAIWMAPTGTAWIVFVLAFVLIVWYWIFCWAFSSSFGLFLYSLAYVIALIFVFTSADSKFGYAYRERVGEFYGYIISLTLLATIAFAATSFNAAFSTEKDGITPLNDYSVLVDRKTDAFVARLPVTKEEIRDANYLVIDSYFINLFKYRVATGIPMSAKIKSEYAFNGYETYKFPYEVRYVISRDNYPAAWKRWKNKQALEKEIVRQVNEALTRLNEREREIEAFAATRSITMKEAMKNRDLIPNEEKKLNQLFREMFAEELKKVVLPGVMITLA